MKKLSTIRMSVLALATILLVQPAQAMWDMLAVLDSTCTASGGEWQGIGCKGSSSGVMQRRIDEERRKREQADQLRADTFERDYLSWMSQYNPTSAFPGAPTVALSFPPSDILEAFKSYLCLHASLMTLALADDNPELFITASRFSDLTGHRNAPQAFATNHAQAAYFHLNKILQFRHLEGFRLEIENPEHRDIVHVLLAREMVNAFNTIGIRVLDYDRLVNGGAQQLDSFIRNIGFDLRSTDFYQSELGQMNCQPPAFDKHLYQSPKTTAFLQSAIAEDLVGFSMEDLLLSSDTSQFDYANEVDQLAALLNDKDSRPILLHTEISWRTDVMKKLSKRIAGDPRRGVFVQLKEGDPVPGYAEFFEFGFPVRTAIFVPDLNRIAEQSDRTLIRLIYGSMNATMMSIDQYVELYKNDPEELRIRVERNEIAVCRKQPCQ